MRHSNISVIDYKPEHQPYFEKLNKDWLEQFGVEPLDKYVLENPNEAILKPGGAILMALYNYEIAGTVALRKISPNTFEFTKMTVHKDFRRRGIAEALSYASFEKAKQLNATKVVLYSQTVLQAAIHLYRKLGFKEVPMEEGIYKRANIKMEIILSGILIPSL